MTSTFELASLILFHNVAILLRLPESRRNSGCMYASSGWCTRSTAPFSGPSTTAPPARLELRTRHPSSRRRARDAAVSKPGAVQGREDAMVAAAGAVVAGGARTRPGRVGRRAEVRRHSGRSRAPSAAAARRPGAPPAPSAGRIRAAPAPASWCGGRRCGCPGCTPRRYRRTERKCRASSPFTIPAADEWSARSRGHDQVGRVDPTKAQRGSHGAPGQADRTPRRVKVRLTQWAALIQVKP